MRLKSLRKERPAFEIEGAVINGNRIDLSKGDLKPTKQRSNTSFALPASLNIDSSSLNILSTNRTHEMSTPSRQQRVVPTSTVPSKSPSYQTLETAYLEKGIRIRLSPIRKGQQSERKSATDLQRHTAFVSRNPTRTTSVLHYTMTNLDQHHHSRPFSALQQTSSNYFEQPDAPYVSYAHPSQIDEESLPHDYLSSSIIASEHSNPITPPQKYTRTNNTPVFDNDPDLAYMSTLLKTPTGDTFLDTLRRRAGLRGTFATHRNPLAGSSVQSNTREKSSRTNQHPSARPTTAAIPPVSSGNKVDQDIIKHASRIRQRSQSKEIVLRPSTASSPSRTNNNNKPLKSMSLEPLEFLLSPASLSAHDLRTKNKPSSSRKASTSTKRPKSSIIPVIETNNSDSLFSKDDFVSSSMLPDESLSLMRTSPLDMAHQTNSFDSGYYDHSSSGGDIQSLSSSSNVRIPSSMPSTRLTNSAARRSNTNKHVSFYDERSTVVLTTATYI